MLNLKNDFPILKNNSDIVFLDSAASTQKPKIVIDTVTECYEKYYANIHRGLYRFSIESTQRFEKARKTVQKFLNAKFLEEIIFVRGGTEAINLVASSYGENFLKKGDEIILTELEHHANIVPWQILSKKIGIKINYIPLDDNGDLVLEKYYNSFNENTKFVSLTHVSNALGTVLPVKDMIKFAHEKGAKILIDGCQSVAHMKVDVQDLDADFYVFSGHKLYAPSGIGVLYGKKDLLNKMPPYQTGGDMILSVTKENTIFNELPHKFEAGTPAIAQAIGLASAINYIENIGLDKIQQHDQDLIKYAHQELSKVDGLTIYSNASNIIGAISFNVDDIHAHDMGTFMDNCNVAIRAGHHCAQLIIDRFNISSTVRASFGIYNDITDIDKLISAILKAKDFFIRIK